MKGTLTNWHFARILRLVLAVVILVQGIVGKDWTSIAFGILFGGMAVANIGCCGAGCSVNIASDNKARKINNEELDAKQ